MLQGLTTNKAFTTALAAIAALQAPENTPMWLKGIIVGAGWLLTFAVPNKDTASKGEHEAA